MRGVKSYAMLLCASSKEGKEGGGVEFVLPPAGSQPGERIYFEGEKYESEPASSMLLRARKQALTQGSQTLRPRRSSTRKRRSLRLSSL